jgi:hypothetical protein
MKDRELEQMEFDDLWDLHQRIIEVLTRKLENEKRKLQNQLDNLVASSMDSLLTSRNVGPTPGSSRSIATRITRYRHGRDEAKPHAG